MADSDSRRLVSMTAQTRQRFLGHLCRHATSAHNLDYGCTTELSALYDLSAQDICTTTPASRNIGDKYPSTEQWQWQWQDLKCLLDPQRTESLMTTDLALKRLLNSTVYVPDSRIRRHGFCALRLRRQQTCRMVKECYFWRS